MPDLLPHAQLAYGLCQPAGLALRLAHSTVPNRRDGRRVHSRFSKG